jgi:CrcB protein
LVSHLCLTHYLGDNNSISRSFKEGVVLKAVLLVSAGGILGSLTRLTLGFFFPTTAQGNLAANIIASALAAFFLVLMERRGITELRWFLLPGFCGGLGTFSAITYEVVERGEGGPLYLFLNVILCLLVVAIAIPLARKWVPVR